MYIRRWLAGVGLVVTVVALTVVFVPMTHASGPYRPCIEYPGSCPCDRYPEFCDDDGGGGDDDEGGGGENGDEGQRGDEDGGQDGGDGEPPLDSDGDGVPDVEDPDDDGDGYTDATEGRAGTDGKAPNSTPQPVPDDVASITSTSGVPPGVVSAGDPINTLTGEHILREVDLLVPGNGFPFEFVRTYNSNSPITEPFGPGWTHTYNRRLVMNWDYSIDVTDGTGLRVHYDYVPTSVEAVNGFDGDPLIEIRLDLGYFKSSPLNTNALLRNPDGTYTERTKHGIAYHYAGYWARWRGSDQPVTAGRLSAITDPNGNRMTFHYDDQGRLVRIVDTAGRTFTLTYEGTRLRELQDPVGRRIQYVYDDANRLTQVIDPAGGRHEYRYDSENRLAEQIDPRGNRLRYLYDANGRLTRVIGPDGNVFNRFEYARDGGFRTEYRDPRGMPTVYTYNTKGQLVSVEDATGAVTRYEYDESYNPIRVIDPSGATVRLRYDERKNLVELVDRAGQVYRFAYEPTFDRPIEIVDPLGHRTRMTYDARGNLMALEDPLGRVTRYAYDPRGRLLAVTDPRGAIHRFEYDEAGNVTALRDPSGATTRFTYDGVGRLLRVIDPNGSVTTFEYDPAGRLVRMGDGLGGQHRYSYDPEGHLVAYTDPAGYVFRWSYDAFGRVVSHTDAAGNRTTYRYDPSGNLVEVEDALGNRTRMAYDAVGRLIDLTDAEGQRSRFEYDGMGRLIRSVDPLGRVRRFRYDVAGRLVREVDPAGGTIEYSYDPLGRLIAMKDPAGHVFRWTYDAAGQLIEEQSPDGRIRYSYDAAGNLAARTDLAGRTTRFAYDSRGLLTEVRYPDETLRFGYDAAGNMVEMQSPALTERYRYDALGRLIEAENVTLGKRLRYAYDARGLRTRLVDPEGRTFAYEYDALGRLVRFFDPLGGQTRFRYDALSRLERLEYPNGVTTTFAFDRVSRLLELVSEGSMGRVLRLAYRYDGAGNPVERREGPHGPVPEGVARFSYDALDRLVGVTYPLEAIQVVRSLTGHGLPPGLGVIQTPPRPQAGPPSAPGSGRGKGRPPGDDEGGGTWPEPVAWAAYRYDPVGNRLRLETDRGGIDYAYAGLNRLVRAGMVQYRYDANGNLTEKLTPEGWVRYTYNARNELTRVDFPDGTWVTYAYDGFGRRVRREESYWQNENHPKTEITHYLYDGFEVLMEYAGTPGEGLVPLAEYYRADGPLIARKMFGFHGRKAPGHEEFLRTRGGLLYYHLDALGTVQALTDRQGEVVVRYYTEAFGQVWAGVMDPYNLYALTAKAYDPKTGLYYFGARWYDPEVGRWLTPDPIRDGLNWYAYVGNNPVRYTDPWGLFRLDKSGAQAIVERGDTLSAIAQAVYGDAALYKELAAVNNVAKPDLIYPGQRIQLPRPLPSGQGPNAQPADLDIFLVSLGAVASVQVGPAVWQAVTAATTWMIAKVQTWLTPATPNRIKGAWVVEKAASTPIGRRGQPLQVLPRANAPALIGGRLYTGHALDQMQSRGIMPSVVEEAIRTGIRSPGNTPETFIYTTEQVRVVVNEAGHVVTVIPQ